MKKAILTAILLSSVSVASANPFTDVPRGHWAYDAIEQLREDGIIEGYGDDSYRGERTITRYEMAQMIARALDQFDQKVKGLADQKPVVQNIGADRAMLDRLSAEFHDELDSLGVRVSNLEKYADKVKFTGLVRMDFSRDKAYPWAWLINGGSYHSFMKEKTNVNKALLRMDFDAEINPKWHAKARFESTTDLKNDSSSDVTTPRAYAEGQLGNLTKVRVGHFDAFNADNLMHAGFVIDADKIKGGELIVGSRTKLKLTGARLNHDYIVLSHGAESNSAIEYIVNKWEPADYQAAELYGKLGRKFDWALGYHRVSEGMLEKSFHTEKQIIGSVGMDYRFDKNIALGLFYSRTSLDVPQDDFFGDDDEKYGYSAQIQYKGADYNDKGSYGVYVAYRHIGAYSAIAPTFSGVQLGFKGIECGLEYVITPRFSTKLVGMWGHNVGSGEITQRSRVAEQWLGGYAEERSASHFLGRVEYRF